MAKFIVNCTQIWNGVKEIEADSKEEALSRLQELICEDLDNVEWTFGEATADYAE